jgi:hypothetical protein
MKLVKFGIVAGIVTLSGLSGLSGVAHAQESEFAGKIQADMDGYKDRIVTDCGTTPKLVLRFDGKLGSNPRETKDGDYSSVSTLCTSALEGLQTACHDNKVVKQAVSKVATLVCTRGKGTLDYKIKGGTITFTLDTAFDKNNAAGQTNALVDKLKKDLDK